MDYRLDQQVAVVTGAARGLGRAIALELARHGAFVVVNDKDEPGGLTPTVQLITEQGGRGQFHRADVTRPDQVEAMFKAIYQEHRRVDILINNAGVSRSEFFMLMRPQDWHDPVQ